MHAPVSAAAPYTPQIGPAASSAAAGEDLRRLTCDSTMRDVSSSSQTRDSFAEEAHVHVRRLDPHAAARGDDEPPPLDEDVDPIARLREAVCAADGAACHVIMSDTAELGRFLSDCGGHIDGQDGAAQRLRRAIVWRRRCEESQVEHPNAMLPAMELLPRSDPPPGPQTAGRRVRRDDKPRAVLVNIAEFGSRNPEAIIFAFFLCWNGILRRIKRDRAMTVAISISGTGGGPSPAVGPALQRISACLSLYYPLRLGRVVVFPCPHGAAEKRVKDMSDVVDVGKTLHNAELVFCPTRAAAAEAIGIPIEDLVSSPGRRRHVDVAGLPATVMPTLVYTPWCHSGVQPGVLTLEEELAVFSKFVLPTEQEKARRNAIRAVVQQACDEGAHTRGSTVKLVGSGALNLFTPFCPMQLAADVPDGDTALKVLLAAGMTPAPRDECGTDVSGKSSDCIHVRSTCGTMVELLLGAKGADARASVSLWREWTARTPAITGAFCVLRCVLGQAGYGSGPKGVGPFALLAMLCHVALQPADGGGRSQGRRRGRRGGRDAPDTARGAGKPQIRDLLSKFFTYYSMFDFEHHSIDPAQQQPQPRLPEHDGHALSVLGPRGLWNFAASCKHAELFRHQLKYCAQALAKAECKSGAAQRRQTRRTPLSQLLSHTPLWSRCRDILAQTPPTADPAESEEAGRGHWGPEDALHDPRVAANEPVKIYVNAGKTYLWCACGHSKSQPLCDGSHHTVNAQEGTNYEPLVWVPTENALVSFCMCKRSKKAPFCDGSHRDIEDLASGPRHPAEADRA